MGGRPSGRAAEFALTQELLEEFNIPITNGIGFHFNCNDEDLYVVTGGYDMIRHRTNDKAYIYDKKTKSVTISKTDFVLRINKAASGN